MLKGSLIISAVTILAVLASQSTAEAGSKKTSPGFNAKVTLNPVTQSTGTSDKFSTLRRNLLRDIHYGGNNNYKPKHHGK